MQECPSCGTANQATDRFCINCGRSLGQDAPDELINAGIVCPNCDTYNEPDQKTCIRCGQSISGLTGFLESVEGASDHREDEKTVVVPKPAGARARPTSPVPDTQPEMPIQHAHPLPRPPQKVSEPETQTGQMPAAVAGEPTADSCPYCQAGITEGAQFCLACGQKLVPTSTQATAGADVSIRLRLVRGRGREDSTFPVGPAGVTVGRVGALISIPDDPYLSPLHLILRLEGSKLVVVDAGSHNGTFLRVRERSELRQGAEFIVGSQRMLLLGLGGPTTDVRTPSSQDTRAYGGPLPRQLFVALRLLHASQQGQAMAGVIMLRSGPVISVGQSGCDINFPTDSCMAHKHLELHLRSSGLQVVEAGSSSGVYLRIAEPATLSNGDEIMAGEEVFRVEMG